MIKWKYIWGYMFLLCSCAMLTGCYSLPAEEMETAVRGETTADPGLEALDRQRLTDSFSLDGNVTVRVDADVPEETAKVPLVQFEPYEITMNDVKHWAKIFFGEQELYEPMSSRTWEEANQKIKWMEDKISNRDALLAEYFGNDEEVDNIINYYIEQIEKYRGLYGYDFEPLQTDWIFHSGYYFEMQDTYWDNMGYIESYYEQSDKFAVTGDIDGEQAEIMAVNDRDSGMCNLSFWYENAASWLDCEGEPMLSQEEAVRLADEMVPQLTDEDWHLSEVQSRGNLWQVYYTPAVAGISQNFQYYIESWYWGKSVPGMSYGHLRIDIIDDRICAVRYECPMAITFVEEQDETLQPLSQIYEAFQSYMKNQDIRSRYLIETESWMNDEERTNTERANTAAETSKIYIDVTSVKRGIFRETVIDEAGSYNYQYVPVWAFYGKVYPEDNTVRDEMRGYTSNELVWMDELLCVIDAADGSVLDLQTDYWEGYIE